MLQSNQKDLSNANAALIAVDRFQPTYTEMVPHYMMTASIETSLRFMATTRVILGSISSCSIINRTELVFDWQNHLCPDYKIFLVRVANKNLLKHWSAVISRLPFESSVYKISFLAVNFQKKSSHWLK